ncbi:MAG: hypothetical protein FJY97_05425 [candidate division Zixibacteria bacterium]|nr:hypothetical protein [candidate division Zixibacteria bacterium]
MSADPHRQQRVTRDHYVRKTEVGARLFAVLDWSVDDRDMTLIPHLSRAVRRGDILELAVTDESETHPGGSVQRVAYLCFAEATEAGLLLAGDRVTVGPDTIGVIAGFDETHMPNHLNVILHAETRKTGRDMDLKPDMLITFEGILEEKNRRMGFVRE